jgi:DMSO reductase family type II enzyme heme b subunit
MRPEALWLRLVTLGVLSLGPPGGLPAAGQEAPAAAAAAPAEPSVSVPRVAGKGPILEAAAFAGSPRTTVALLPQVITTPRHMEPSVGSVAVSAVRNADHAGFLLEWSDTSADWRTGIDRFGDMVAIAFPVQPGTPPAPFMGNAGGRVQILQWRADWQSDVERGPISVKELYPDAYPADFHHEDHLPAQAAAAYRGAAGLGNPMSEGRHTSSVQDLMAEGFGSLTPRPVQAGQGSARHDGSGWHVVITRPLAADGDSAPGLSGGTRAWIAFAVWDGSKGEVGARKAWASGVPLEVAE